VTKQYVAFTGLFGFISTFLVLKEFELNTVLLTTFCMLGTALPMILLEIFVLKVHGRDSAGLDARKIHPLDATTCRRIAVKWLGFVGTLALIAFTYWLFPEYGRDFYKPFWSFAILFIPVLLVFSIPYFVYVDRRMKDPDDGYLQAGYLFLGKLDRVDARVLKEYFLGWIIKGFFLPLMFVYFERNLEYLSGTATEKIFNSFTEFVGLFGRFATTVDLAFVSIGYILTFRLTDSHIRSPNPFVYGWVVTLFMYAPFFSLFGNRYLDYKDGSDWADMFGAGNEFLIYVWGTAIILTKVIWAWSNVSFGIRFSNLTHRGIITNGPYRWMRHPSYFFKNVSWWLIAVPFFSTEEPAMALRHSVLFLGINLIYFLRAKAEEAHLSEDPRYVEYAMWIEAHGKLRWMRRIFPFTRYVPPKSYRDAPA
jgi:protein-S-isoprenylcysteine O-methyltransferase Ste14